MLTALAANERRLESGRLCSVCAAVLSVSGAGIVIMREGRSGVTVCASDSVAAAVEELQFDVGEGPGVDAFASNHPVLEGHLARSGGARWPGFTPRAIVAGVGAVFGFPLRVDEVTIGAMDLYQTRPGDLTVSQVGDAEGVADVVAARLLGWQAGVGGATVPAELDDALESRAVVHQATGMVSVQLAVTPGEAFLRLQGWGVAHNRALLAVAVDVVGRRLRFE
jgi:hypothetical protein